MCISIYIHVYEVLRRKTSFYLKNCISQHKLYFQSSLMIFIQASCLQILKSIKEIQIPFVLQVQESASEKLQQKSSLSSDGKVQQKQNTDLGLLKMNCGQRCSQMWSRVSICSFISAGVIVFSSSLDGFGFFDFNVYILLCDFRFPMLTKFV